MAYGCILVPLDGSHLAEFIIPHVENIAGAFDAQVILLHVIESKERSEADLTPSQRRARQDITAYLEHVSESLSQGGVRCEWAVSIGDPAVDIPRHAAQRQADLIIMSTRGYGGASQDRVGSVAAAVVASGKTPVLLAKPPKEVAAR